MPKTGLTARREARKRRILENSETRLTKIISFDRAQENDFGISYNDSTWNHCNGVDIPVSHSDIENDLELELDSELNNQVNEETLPNYDENLSPQLSEEKPVNAAENEERTSNIFWVDCLFIVFLSFSIRLMYWLNVSTMFAESIFVPFVTISVAKMAANPIKCTMKTTKYGTIIRTMLLLFGIPVLYVDTIFQYLQAAIDLGNDFALYLFSFAVCHTFFESFVNR